MTPPLDERLLAVTRRWRLALPVLAAIALALAWSAWQRGWVRLNYPSYARFPVQGVDVSHHQGAIDWSALAGAHARFAWVKASEGADHRDRYFRRNFAAAARGHGLPPAVDLEYGGNCAHRPTKDVFARELRAFLVEVEQAWGCQPVLYVTKDFYPDYVEGRFPTHRLWVRDIVGLPALPDGREWRVWQYAHRAHLPGVTGFIDRNAFAGTPEEFAAFLCRGAPAETKTGVRVHFRH